MEIFSPTAIKELLAKHGARPSKGLGQNFLIDKNTLDAIMKAADLHSMDTVVEIGPGIGTLTQSLAKKAKKVIAIEKDWAMLQILKETLKEYDNVQVVSGNALEYTPPASYKLVANIPYYITSPVIRKFLEEKNRPAHMVLMIQKEVAQRICAKPGDMSILAVSVQFYAAPKIISYISKGCFWPAPNVDSAIIKITPFSKAPATNPEAFFRVVKAGFLHPRKKLINNLAEGLTISKEQVNSWLINNKIDSSRRAEALTIEEWQALTMSLQIE